MFTSVAGKNYAYFVYFFLGLVGGSMLWCMLGIARLMSSLGKDVTIQPSIFDTKTSSLRTASSILWKVSFVAALMYILGISQIYFCSIYLGTFSKSLTIFFGMFIGRCEINCVNGHRYVKFFYERNRLWPISGSYAAVIKRKPPSAELSYWVYRLSAKTEIKKAPTDSISRSHLSRHRSDAQVALTASLILQDDEQKIIGIWVWSQGRIKTWNTNKR